MVKLLWNNHGVEEATSKSEELMKTKYPCNSSHELIEFWRQNSNKETVVVRLWSHFELCDKSAHDKNLGNALRLHAMGVSDWKYCEVIV